MNWFIKVKITISIKYLLHISHNCTKNAVALVATAFSQLWIKRQKISPLTNDKKAPFISEIPSAVEIKVVPLKKKAKFIILNKKISNISELLWGVFRKIIRKKYVARPKRNEYYNKLLSMTKPIFTKLKRYEFSLTYIMRSLFTAKRGIKCY